MGWNTDKPGLMTIIAPTKPAATPAQRRGPTCSFRISAASAVIISGATSNTAVALASGTWATATKKHRVAPKIRPERTNWIRG
jgi:hypothetical protein